MHVKYSCTYSGNCAAVTVDLSEYTARLGEPYRPMLTAAMARRASMPPFKMPDCALLQRVTSQASGITVEVSLGSLTNGYRMDAVEEIQTGLTATIEPAAANFLELLRLMLEVVAIHEGNSGMSHPALKDEIRSLRNKVDVHYDRVTDIHNDHAARAHALSNRVSWVETTLRALPLIGQRFALPASDAGLGEEAERDG